MGAYKDAAYETNQVFIKVAVSHKFLPMITRRIMVLGASTTFALLNMRQDWLHRSICGNSQGGSQGGSRRLARVTLIATLHDIVGQIIDGKHVSEAVADECGDAHADDPMNDIDAPFVETPRKTRGSGVKRQKNTATVGKVVTVELPLRSPEMDPTCKHKYKARLFVEHRSQVWLHLDDVNWAVKYMYSQYVLKGVAYVSPDDAGPSAADEVEPPVHAGISVDDEVGSRMS